jgi:hypothetical protein
VSGKATLSRGELSVGLDSAGCLRECKNESCGRIPRNGIGSLRISVHLKAAP